MAVEFDFPQGRLPVDVAGWQRAARRARTSPSPGSVTPTELATSTTALIDTTAQNAASAAASAAEAAAVAAANANATNLAASAQANAIANAAAALAGHASDLNAHSQYLTQAEGDARYLQQTLSLINAADDVAAGALGVAVGRLYRNGSIVMVRVS